MHQIKFIIFSFIFITNVYSNDYLANSKKTLTLGIWASKIGGTIKNGSTNIDFRNTLGYGSSNNITYLGLILDNNTTTIPDIKFSAYILTQSTNPTVSNIIINDINYTSKLSTDITYMSANTILYGTISKNNLNIDMGLNLKYINYIQNVKQTTPMQKTTTKFSGIIPLPYLAANYKIHKLHTILNIEYSGLSIGDIQLSDYSYGFKYYIMQNVSISINKKQEILKAKNGNDRFNYNISGSLIAINIIF